MDDLNSVSSFIHFGSVDLEMLMDGRDTLYISPTYAFCHLVALGWCVPDGTMDSR
jgi:hypothetical protein